jgi:hypothetical protein
MSVRTNLDVIVSSDCEEFVLCCKYSPLGDVFAVGLGNGAIKVIHAHVRHRPAIRLFEHGAAHHRHSMDSSLANEKIRIVIDLSSSVRVTMRTGHTRVVTHCSTRSQVTARSTAFFSHSSSKSPWRVFAAIARCLSLSIDGPVDGTCLLTVSFIVSTSKKSRRTRPERIRSSRKRNSSVRSPCTDYRKEKCQIATIECFTHALSLSRLDLLENRSISIRACRR